MLVTGDFNIDVLRFTDIKSTGDFTDNVLASGFMPLVTCPTRVTDYSATLIDNILANCVEKFVKSNIVYFDISDHFPTFTEFNFNIPVQNNKSICTNPTRSFSSANFCTFSKLVTDTNSDLIVDPSDNPDQMYQSFSEKFLSLVDCAFPKQTPKRYNLRHPWLTDSLIKCCRRKS